MTGKEQADIDSYARTDGKVYLDKLYINAVMVRTGNAWLFRKYGKDQKLYDLEYEARAARRGLWIDANPVPPWQWRKDNNNK
ncbi:thermonuclease family protein [Kaarinaea lacus]